MPAFRIASASGPLPTVALCCSSPRRGPGAPLRLPPIRRSIAVEPASKVQNSSLDAPLFYQLLLGEIELREGQAGTAYQLMLDAARRTKDEQLFRRATEIALQARAGEQALSATLAWRQDAAGVDRCAALPDPAARRAQPHRRCRGAACALAAPDGTADAAGGDRGGAALPGAWRRSQDDARARRARAAPYVDQNDTKAAALVAAAAPGSRR
jgi:hypothetical protein